MYNPHTCITSVIHDNSVYQLCCMKYISSLIHSLFVQRPLNLRCIKCTWALNYAWSFHMNGLLRSVLDWSWDIMAATVNRPSPSGNVKIWIVVLWCWDWCDLLSGWGWRHRCMCSSTIATGDWLLLVHVLLPSTHRLYCLQNIQDCFQYVHNKKLSSCVICRESYTTVPYLQVHVHVVQHWMSCYCCMM